MNRRRGLLAAVAACAAALLPALAPAQGNPIVVHHIGPLTGVLAGSNAEALDGFRMHLEQVNARGGVNDRPLRLEVLDDAQDPKKAAALLQELIAQRKILALVMPRTTPSMESMLPLAVQAGVPIVGPQTGASFVNQPPKREVFTLRISYQREAERAVKLQHSIGARKFALLLADDSFGKDTLVGIERAMAELGIKPVAVARIDNRKPDVKPAVEQFAPLQPEVVMLIVSSKAAGDFVRQYRATGAVASFVSISNTSNNEYVKALGDQARGAIVMQVLPSPFSGATPLAREYAAAAKGNPLSYAGLYGFATAKLLVQGLQRAGREPTPASLINALEALGDHDLGGLRLRYGPGERSGSSFVEATIITHEGRFMR